jgi:hypothetical protein
MVKEVEDIEQCAVCHIKILPEYYFCPNCGKELKPKPLSTSIFAQIKLYAISAILPLICFITISKWKGLAYIREENTSAKIIGCVALSILVGSTLFTFWYAYVTTVTMMNDLTKQINGLL